MVLRNISHFKFIIYMHVFNEEFTFLGDDHSMLVKNINSVTVVQILFWNTTIKLVFFFYFTAELSLYS